MKKYVKADFRSEHRAALKRGRDKKANAAQDKLTKIRESDDPISTAFELLVPDSGPAPTQAGELIRAINRIMYRDYNDGDLFYEGYGMETCGDAVSFLCEKIDDVFQKFDDIATRTLKDDAYTKEINEIGKIVIDYILDNPELITAKNTEDMFDFDGEDFIRENNWEALYDYECDIPDTILEVMERTDYDSNDLRNEIMTWDYIGYDADVQINGYYIYISDLTRDDFDELDHSFGRWIEQYGEELYEEYIGEEEEDEEYDEDEY